MIVSSKVTAVTKHQPVLDYLAGRFTYRSRQEWLTLVADGRVSCNGRVCTPETIVTQGDVVACDLPDVELPEKFDFNYQIIYEDTWLLGINKPGHLLVHDKRRFAQANLIYHLRQRHEPPYPEAKLINRLDKDTSGVVLAARDSQTLQLMQQAFAGQQVKKEYLAVVRGVPSPPSGVIDQPIGRLESLPGVYRFGVVAGGKTAVTHYDTMQTFGDRYTLLRLFPQTGRTHQLRVHLHAIGHTIVGDVLYTLPDAEYLAWFETRQPLPGEPISRQALHCARVKFVHPQTGRPSTLEAPLPPDMAALLSALAETRD
jgi:23S rRNA pseudouridine1911/1915/1917 synthase